MLYVCLFFFTWGKTKEEEKVAVYCNHVLLAMKSLNTPQGKPIDCISILLGKERMHDMINEI